METFDIPARGHFDLECEATTYGPGEFRCPLFLNYYDGSDYHQVELSVTGTAIAPRATDHATKTP